MPKKKTAKISEPTKAARKQETFTDFLYQQNVANTDNPEKQQGALKTVPSEQGMQDF